MPTSNSKAGFLAACVLVSLVMHVGVVYGGFPGPRLAKTEPLRAAAGVSLRTVRASLPREEAAQAEAGVLKRAESKGDVERQAVPLTDEVVAAPYAGRQSAPPPADDPPLPTEAEVFLPRPLLDVVPELQSKVLLAWPAPSAPNTHYTEVLSLFIDEQGMVHRVRVEGSGLPPAFEQVARQAFLGARFAPGRKNQQAVKSHIRIEVSFDSDSATRSQL
jgi:protein TonB